MPDLDVALRLRLINGLKAGSAEAKRDLAGIGAAARGVGAARGIEPLSRDLEGAILRAKRLERQLAGLRNARGFGGIGPGLDGAAASAQRAAAAASRLAASLDKGTTSAASLRRETEGIAAAAERAAKAGAGLRRVTGREGRQGPPRGERPPGGEGPSGPAKFAERAILGPGSLGAAGAAIAAHQAAKVAIKTFADLETAAKQLAITAGKTDAEVAKVVEEYRKLGPALGVSAKEMLEAAQAFVAAGLDFDTAVAAVPATVKAAKASFGELGETAKAGVAAINNLGIVVDDLPAAFDRMAKAGKEGNVELKNLARILPEVAAAGANLGLQGLDGLTDITAALEIIGKVTASADEAANRLTNLFNKGVADETVRNFKKVGESLGRVIDLEKEMVEGAARGESKLAVIIRLTKELTHGNSFRINELFSDSQANQGITALLRFEREYNAMRARITNDSKGMIDADFAQATKRLAADFEKMEAAWDRLMSRMGEAAAPGLSALTKEATGFLERMEQGDTILQRIVKRLGLGGDEAGKKAIEDGLAGEGSLEKWFEKTFPFLSGKVWNERIDGALGKTGRDAEQRHEMDGYRRRAEDDERVRRLPDEIRGRIGRMEEALERARRVAEGPAGPQGDIARSQIAKREADIARLKDELAKATEAVTAMDEARRQELEAIKALSDKLRSMERTGGFGLDGPKGKAGKVGPGAGAFGFGRFGTKDLPGPPAEPQAPPAEPQAPPAEPGEPPAEPEKAPAPEPEEKDETPPRKRSPRAKADAEAPKAEVQAEPQDLSGVGTQTIETYRQAVKAGLDKVVADVAEAVAKMKADLSFTASPTITPRISAPAPGGAAGGTGGGGAGGGGGPPGGGTGAGPGGTKRNASLRGGGGPNFHGPIHVHGVRDVAGLERGIRREADRRAREARNDALHDTGHDFA